MRSSMRGPDAPGRLTLLLVIAAVCVAGASACSDRATPGAAETAAARAAEKTAADAAAREAALVALETHRLADLWSYVAVPAGPGQQVTAAINSANSLDTDGQGPRAVQLVFRDHPSWGRSSYLVLQAGDFDCYGRCTVAVTIDDAAPTPMAARRPRTDEAIAMFINDARSLWRMMDGARQATIEFPVTAGGKRAATFDVAGLDRSKMPGWDPRAPGTPPLP